MNRFKHLLEHRDASMHTSFNPSQENVLDTLFYILFFITNLVTFLFNLNWAFSRNKNLIPHKTYYTFINLLSLLLISETLKWGN